MSDLCASDKDLFPTIKKLIALCTYELAALMQEVDGIQDPEYLMDKQEEIQKKSELIFEENYLEPIYGMVSRLPFEEWSIRSSQRQEIGQVFYEPERLRWLTFTRLGMEFSDKDKFVKWYLKQNRDLKLYADDTL